VKRSREEREEREERGSEAGFKMSRNEAVCLPLSLYTHIHTHTTDTYDEGKETVDIE
jgi:hypothetical protein